MRGVVLFESYLLILLLVGVLFWFHVAVIRDGNHRMHELQKRRLNYDGVPQWTP